MHQPYYEDLATGEHVLPWVRMHGLKDYYGMAALMREFPQVKLTFNLVPSLLVQLEAFAEERARDWHLELGLKPADDAHRARTRDHAVGVLPCAARADDRSLPALRRAAAEARHRRGLLPTRTSWTSRCGTSWHGSIRSISTATRACGDSSQKQRNFTRRRQSASCATSSSRSFSRVIPEYRDAAERGQVELSTSPFYHPILPLLCDTDIYLKTHPASAVPRPPSAIRKTRPNNSRVPGSCHVRLFGHEPAGLWPSEGSVSDETAELAAKAGFQWMATDEAILGRTIGREFRRDCARPARTARTAVPAVHRADWIAADIVSLPRPLALRFDWLRLRRLGRRSGRGRFREPAGRGRPAVFGGDRWGRGHHPGDSRRRKRLGAFRGWRPPVPARACTASCRPSRASTGHDERSGRAARTHAQRHFSRLLDRRQLLHLDWARRRFARLAAASRSSADVRPRLGGCEPGGPRASLRGAAHRRRQRLVLVVRRRPFVRPRPRVRRPVPAAPPERLSDARAASAGRAVRHQHQHRPAACIGRTTRGPSQSGSRRTSRPATSNGFPRVSSRPTSRRAP